MLRNIDRCLDHILNTREEILEQISIHKLVANCSLFSLTMLSNLTQMRTIKKPEKNTKRGQQSSKN